jgi:putative sterol carrier protein
MSEPHEIVAAWASGGEPERAAVKAAVKRTLATLVELAPGRAVEVRVPPYAAVQVIGGTTHRRGTPPAVVECDARTWLELATGALAWGEAVADGRVRASGERSDLSAYLPLEG